MQKFTARMIFSPQWNKFARSAAQKMTCRFIYQFTPYCLMYSDKKESFKPFRHISILLSVWQWINWAWRKLRIFIDKDFSELYMRKRLGNDNKSSSCVEYSWRHSKEAFLSFYEMTKSHNGNESHEYEVNRDDFKWLHVIVSAYMLFAVVYFVNLNFNDYDYVFGGSRLNFLSEYFNKKWFCVPKKRINLISPLTAQN